MRCTLRALCSVLLLSSACRRLLTATEALIHPVGNAAAGTTGRRSFLSTAGAAAAAAVPSAIRPPQPAAAAPPMAVIAEELGYFPVTDSEGRTQYVPARARRHSTDQAVDLARHLQRSRATMYGAYWCPHCSRQREMFGREAWGLVTYVECSPRGYGAEAGRCAREGVDGYPTWRFSNGRVGSGEMTLEKIAEMSGYRGRFDGSLEESLPAGSGYCR